MVVVDVVVLAENKENTMTSIQSYDEDKNTSRLNGPFSSIHV